jgi:hypothetical protein
MHRTLTHAALFLALILPFLAPAPGAFAQPPQSDGRPDQAILQPEPRIGLAPATSYLSPPTAAVRPFDFLLLRREARVPAGAGIALELRVSTDGQTWTGWYAVD